MCLWGTLISLGKMSHSRDYTRELAKPQSNKSIGLSLILNTIQLQKEKKNPTKTSAEYSIEPSLYVCTSSTVYL